jgi:hypothetical protein
MTEVDALLRALVELPAAPEGALDVETLAEQAERFVDARAGILAQLEALRPISLGPEDQKILAQVLEADRRWAGLLLAAREQARARSTAVSRAARASQDAPNSLGGKREA